MAAPSSSLPFFGIIEGDPNHQVMKQQHHLMMTSGGVGGSTTGVVGGGAVMGAAAGLGGQAPSSSSASHHHHHQQHQTATSSVIAGADSIGHGRQTPPLPPQQQQPPQKKRRNLPGTPSKYPDAEVIALSPKTLMATNRFICEVCNKGFQREQNLQLHRRGHNLPWKLKQKSNKDQVVKKKVYLCPEPSCVHHDPARALGDLTGIKKHFSRKHGEKKFKCEKCSKRYAVQSDWKAHTKTCGTREYRCDCGTLFSRRDSFITHRAFCDALAQESARHPSSLSTIGGHLFGGSGGVGGVGATSGITGLGLSHHQLAATSASGVAAGNNHGHHQLSSAASDHILPLGGHRPGQFDHLLPPSLTGGGAGNSAFRTQHQMQSPSSANFYMPQSNQGYNHSANSAEDQSQAHYADHLQTNSNNNDMFNHGFYSNNASNNDGQHHLSSSSLFSPGGQYNGSQHDSTNISSGGPAAQSSNLFSPNNSTILGGGGGGQLTSSSSLSSLFGSTPTGGGNPHMSATALLQKAAQIGSTSTNNHASLLKGFSNNNVTSGSTSAGSGSAGVFKPDNSNNNHMQDLMNSLATASGGGSTGLFAFGGFNGSDKSGGFGNDRLTRDFLGVGEIVRSMSSGAAGGGGQQQKQAGMDILQGQMEAHHHDKRNANNISVVQQNQASFGGDHAGTGGNYQ